MDGIDGDSPDNDDCDCMTTTKAAKPLPICPFGGMTAKSFCFNDVDCELEYYCSTRGPGIEGGCCLEVLPLRQSGINSDNNNEIIMTDDNQHKHELKYYYSHHKVSFMVIISLVSVIILGFIIAFIYSLCKNGKDIRRKLIDNRLEDNELVITNYSTIQSNAQLIDISNIQPR